MTLCGICARPEEDHHSSDVHHEFSRHGQLISKKRRKDERSHTESHADGSRSVSVEVPNRPGDEEPGSEDVPAEHANVRSGSDDVVRSSPSTDQPQARALQALSASADPVLRTALIDAGVLKPEDLTAAENKIAAMIGRPISQIFPNRSLRSTQVNRESE